MVAGVTVTWLLTALFAVTAAGYVHAAARRARMADLHRAADLHRVVDDGLCVLMAVAIVTMLWPWGMAVPVMVYVITFTAAALWFVARALYGSPAGAVGSPGGSGGTPWYHAATMMSMIFIAVAMSAAAAASLDVSTGSGTAMDMDMSGMDMTGMDMSGGGAVTAFPQEIWVRAPSVVLALGFVVAAVRFTAMAVRRREQGSVPVGVTGALMAAGMAVVFGQMV